jgi:putative ABC transport system permease protein
MIWSELVLDTLRSVRVHAMRFGLTSLGVFWGVLMLTFLSATSVGYDRHFGDMVEKIGQRIVYLFPGAISKDTSGQRASRSVVFEDEDIVRVAGLHSVERAASNLWLGAKVFRAEQRSKLIWTYGGDESTGAIRNYEVESGRLINRRYVIERREVVFLGYTAAQRIFGSRPAVGRDVTIESIPYRVIGVSKEKGEQMVGLGPADDELALIPVTTAQRWISHDSSVGNIIFEPTVREVSWSAIEHARGLLGLHQRFDYDDTSAVGSFNVQDVMGILGGILFGLKLFLISASLITLFVGGAGVMNIMLVVVTERTREIGLRKAIGASNRAIFVQFLAESLCVTLISGAAGAALGSLLVFALARMTVATNSVLITPILVPGILAGIFVSVVVIGVVSGLLPAIRASRIEPAISLRA